MEHAKPSVRCTNEFCRLVQFVRPHSIQRCRKCREILPPAVVPKLDHIIWPEALPTFDEVLNELVKEALIRTDGDKQAAARLIQCGKTTLYRRLNEMEHKQNPSE